MSDNSAPPVNWNQLLGKLAGNNGFNPQFSSDIFFSTVSNGGARIDYMSTESRGKRILEYDLQRRQWNAFEREGMRWEPANLEVADQKILEQYKTALEKY
jgi:hypothetical protein